MRAHLLAVGLAVSVVSAPALAAEPNESGGAAAESLFQEGRHAMEAKKYGDACPKFLASYKLQQTLGTLLNLADCYEKNGQLASAWARFHEAIGLAQRLGRADREKTARERADKLDPRLIRLTILSQEKNIEVKLDGNALDSAVLGTPVPIDPGKHTIEANAKGKKSFTTSIDVSERSKSPSVEIPELEASKEEPPPETKPKETVVTPPDGGGWGTQKTLGAVVLGVGVVGLGVGAFFGLRTSATWSDAKTHCNTNLECDKTGVDLAGKAKTAGDIATIAFIAGGVATAAGAALFFTAPSAKTGSAQRSVQVGVGPGDVIVRGTF